MSKIDQAEIDALSPEKQNQIYSCRRFLEDTWKIDGECTLDGFTEYEGVLMIVFKLTDSKRGEWYVAQGHITTIR